MNTPPLPRVRQTLLLGALLASLGAISAQAAPASYRIDPEHLSIAFQVRHVGYADVIGLFLKAEGEFLYDEHTRELSTGRFVVEADSVFTNHDRRDRHLRDRDFLQTSRHPRIVFEATRYLPGDNGKGRLEGNLTLLGQTHPVVLETTLNKSAAYPFGHRKPTLGISARTTLLRSQWGMNYALKDDMVGDAVEMRFEFEAIRQD